MCVQEEEELSANDLSRPRLISTGPTNVPVPTFPMNIPSFAFPQGLRCSWNTDVDGPRSYSFTMTQEEGNAVYGHCFLCHHKARDRLLAIVRLQEYLPTMSSRNGNGEDWVDTIRKTELFEPGVIGIITSRPLHSVIKRVLDVFAVRPLVKQGRRQNEN